MSSRVHCPCSSSARIAFDAPPSPRADYEYHELADLYFCEECDAIKCSRCVTEEVSVFYCPNCLFEVPTASVRGEKNRCARNCFQCPICANYLSVTSSDPAGEHDPAQASSSVGEPPYFLACTYCRWDSKEIGLSFDKPTGLSAVLQKQDDSTPLLPSFEQIRDHLDPFVRAGIAASQTAATAKSKPLTGTIASSSRFGSLHSLAARSRSAAAAQASASFKDELSPFVPVHPAASQSGVETEEARMEDVRTLKSLDGSTGLMDRAGKAWDPPLLENQLRPTRVQLHAKFTRRCPDCKHILSKPDSKAVSTKFRIKLIAPHYLPRINIARRTPSLATGPRISAVGSASSRIRQASERPADDPLRSGRSYSFEMAFINPLYEPIQIRLAIVSGSDASLQLSLGCTVFPVAAFAEQWEYDDEDEELGIAKPQKRMPAGVIERKANRTTVPLELTVDKDYVGPAQAQMFVTYRYEGDDEASGDKDKRDNVKSFSYWTLVDFGAVQAAAQPLRARQSVVPMTT